MEGMHNARIVCRLGVEEPANYMQGVIQVNKAAECEFQFVQVNSMWCHVICWVLGLKSTWFQIKKKIPI